MGRDCQLSMQKAKIYTDKLCARKPGSTDLQEKVYDLKVIISYIFMLILQRSLVFVPVNLPDTC